MIELSRRILHVLLKMRDERRGHQGVGYVGGHQR